MSWRKNKVDVNDGAGGDRWIGREVAKLYSKKLRRRWDKFLSREGSKEQ